MEKKGIGIVNLPNQRYRSFCQRGIQYNIMLVGSRGSGKSTFINMLLNSNVLHTEPFSTEAMAGASVEFRSPNYPHNIIRNSESGNINAGVGKPADDSKGIGKALHSNNMTTTSLNVNIPNNPSPHSSIGSSPNIKNISLPNHNIPLQYSSASFMSALVNFQVTHAHFTDKRFNVRLTITEVDGVGDQINNDGCWAPILAHVSEMHAHYGKQLASRVRGKVDDRRIHVILFFVEAAAVPVRALDTAVMRELSRVANLVPVVARSDFLTDSEAADFYARIRNHLEREGIAFCDPRALPLWTKINADAPFFVVAGSQGSIGLSERVLPFARVDTAADEFRDLRVLRRILIDDHMLDLIETTDYFYELFRADHLSQEIRSKDGYSEAERALVSSFLTEMREQEGAMQRRTADLLARKSALEAEIKALSSPLINDNKNIENVRDTLKEV